MQVRRRSAKCDVDCDVQRGIIAVRSTSLNTTACQTAARACDAVVCVLCLHKPRHQKVTLVLHGGDLSSVIGSWTFPLTRILPIWMADLFARKGLLTETRKTRSPMSG